MVRSNSLSNLDAVVRQMLREDIPLQLRAFHAAVAQNALEHAAEVVHSVRGTAAFCQLNELRDVANHLETALQNKDEYAALARNFENAALQVLHALEHEDQTG